MEQKTEKSEKITNTQSSKNILRAVFWDMDGTLLDSEPAHAASFADALAELGLSVPPGFHDGLLGLGVDHVYAALVATTGATLSIDEWQALKWRHFQRRSDVVTVRGEVAAQARELAAQGVEFLLLAHHGQVEGVDLFLLKRQPNFQFVDPFVHDKAFGKHQKRERILRSLCAGRQAGPGLQRGAPDQADQAVAHAGDEHEGGDRAYLGEPGALIEAGDKLVLKLKASGGAALHFTPLKK